MQGKIEKVCEVLGMFSVVGFVVSLVIFTVSNISRVL